MEPTRTQLYPAGASRTNGVDRVFNYLENNHQESTLLERQIYEHQQQHRRYKSQISTYEARIRRFEKDLAKRDEEKQSLKGQVRLLQDHVKSLMFEKGNLSSANAMLETKIEGFESKIIQLNTKWLKVGESISSKVSNYLKAFDFDKICKEVANDVGDLQKADISDSPQTSTNGQESQIVDHATEQSNAGDVCEVLPKTYNELKAKYISLDGQYKSLYTHYEELSREYEKVMSQFTVAYKSEDMLESSANGYKSEGMLESSANENVTTDSPDSIPKDKTDGPKQAMDVEGRKLVETGKASKIETAKSSADV